MHFFFWRFQQVLVRNLEVTFLKQPASISAGLAVLDAIREDMDLNAGVVMEGQELQAVGDEFFEYALRVASGEKTASEKLGFGDHEFVPWTVGPTV